MTTHRAHSILVVGDQSVAAADIQPTLRAHGYTTYGLGASDALGAASAGLPNPDLVVMSIPSGKASSGIWWVEHLRRAFDVPFVFVLADVDVATLKGATQETDAWYLLPPLGQAELLRVVGAALRGGSKHVRPLEREAWCLAALQSVGDAALAVSAGGAVVAMNRAAEVLAGLTEAAAVGRPVDDVLRLASNRAFDDRMRLLRAVTSGCAAGLGDVEVVNPAGGPSRLVVVRVAPVRETDGQAPFGCVVICHDVTEERLLGVRCAQRERLVALGEVAARVAHEVNNPVGVIVMNAAIMDDDLGGLAAAPVGAADAERYRRAMECLADIRLAADHLTRIAAELRTFAAPVVCRRERIDMVRAVGWAVRACAREFENRAALCVAPVPTVRAVGDEDKLAQVLINLLVNAARAIGPGRPAENQVEVVVRDEGSGVTLMVRDTGSGIAPDALERVFEPFYTTQASGVGTGLGLPISRAILAAMGGTIAISSVVGVGTSVRVWLPQAPASSKGEATVAPGEG